MGVTHKLKPQVKDFILLEKQRNPAISCRGLSSLVLTKFKVDVSKSSINSIFKESGLSLPVGRHPKKKRKRIEMPPLPALTAKDIQISSDTEEKIRIAQQEAARAAEQKKIEDERKALEDALRRAEAERLKLEAESRRLEELKKSEEDARRAAEEEERKLKEEQKRVEEERKQQEEAVRRAEEEKQKAEAEKAKAEEEKLKAEEELRRQEEEALRLEKLKWEQAADEERRKKEEVERIAKEGAARKAEEEKQKAEDEAKRKAAEEAMARRAEEEKAQAEDAKHKAEEASFKAAHALNFEEPKQLTESGIIFLRCADYLLGGTQRICEALRAKLGLKESEIRAQIESLLYLPLFAGDADPKTLEGVSGFLDRLEQTGAAHTDISRIVSSLLQEIRCVKVSLSDGNALYLDGSMYSAWSTTYIPYDFSAPAHSLKERIHLHLGEHRPFILLNAPGYESPTAEFFYFLSALETSTRTISQLTLCGNKFEEIEQIPVHSTRKTHVIFGMWPWQFTQQRKVIKIGEYKPWTFPSLNKQFYLAEIEIELAQAALNQKMVLRGAALKTSLEEKVRLVILSNFSAADAPPEDLALRYLSHWPNLEEAFQDYSRKIEHLTYAAGSQRFFPTDASAMISKSPEDLKRALEDYLKVLDAYVRWHLLPEGYEDKDFAFTREYFYSLKGLATPQDKELLASFEPPMSHPAPKDLDYLCRRVNEKAVILPDKKRLWLSA